MPDVLWPIFQKNRHLLHGLPKLRAAVIQQWVKLKYGVRVSIMVVPHTFGVRLNSDTLGWTSEALSSRLNQPGQGKTRQAKSAVILQITTLGQALWLSNGRIGT